ncbi:MAG: DUF418 domain-containing protein [Verrucomicrobia bacterium]|nr:DUF418 domain-containing protein [Verrucomicrobiota bacterium]
MDSHPSPPPLLPAPTTAPVFAPTTSSRRLVNMDFARGMALFGILVVNTAILFGPLDTLIRPLSAEGSTGVNWWVAFLVLVLFQGKFVSVFSLLFGYGLLGQIERAHASGWSATAFAFRRLGVLAVFGLIHALVFWYGDILFLYALMGGWLLLARGASWRALLVTACLLLLVGLVLNAAFAALTVFASSFDGDAGILISEGWPAALRAMGRAGFDPSAPVWIEAEVTAFRDGPWLDAQMFRTAHWLLMLVVSPLTFGWSILGMMFAGGLLWRLRFFAPEQAPLRRWTLVIGLTGGLGIEAAAGALFWMAPAPESWTWAAAQVLHTIALWFLPFGYLAAFAELAERLPERLLEPVARTGRLSLTVYLLETVLATALAYHWGLGLFGRVDPAGQFLMAVGIWLLLVGFSHCWLARFKAGPLEILWRRLAYGRGRL